jgi:predicted XRE-type DNA-binding protein
MKQMTVEQIKTELLERIENEMLTAGISQGEVARRTGILRTNVNHIIRRSHATSIETLVEIAESIGLKVELRIKKLKD